MSFARLVVNIGLFSGRGRGAFRSILLRPVLGTLVPNSKISKGIGVESFMRAEAVATIFEKWVGSPIGLGEYMIGLLALPLDVVTKGSRP